MNSANEKSKVVSSENIHRSEQPSAHNAQNTSMLTTPTTSRLSELSRVLTDVTQNNQENFLLDMEGKRATCAENKKGSQAISGPPRLFTVSELADSFSFSENEKIFKLPFSREASNET